MKQALVMAAILSLLILNCSKKTTNNYNYYSLKEGTIIGIVHPPDSQAKVTAYLGMPIASTQIDASGYFELLELPLGTYSLLVEAEGYHDYVSPSNIQVTADVTASVDTILLISVHDLISSVSPTDGTQGVRADQAISITFRTEMDRASVEAAFQVEPSVQGSFTWYDPSRYPEERLLFTPSGKWATNTLYQVTIDTTASDLQGIKLLEPYQFSFTTEPLGVLYTYPAHGYQSVPPNAYVGIRFNADMDIQATNSAFQMFDFQMNPVAGVFSWPNSDYLQFTPHSSLFVKSSYTVRIDTAASDAQGARLPHPYEFYFTTQPIMIEVTSPRNKQTWVHPSAIISIRFNTDMDMESVNSAFNMVDSEENAVDGTVAWPFAYTLEFLPDSPLASDETYTVTVDTNAKDMYGSNMDAAFSFWFKTRPE